MRNNFLRKVELHLRLFYSHWKNREKKILSSVCKGKGADIGCGSNKVSPNCIGIDITSKGTSGKYGCEKNKVSVSDYDASGDNLFMFKDNELDFIVAKHNLEHYDNPVLTIQEWKRVLKKGGKIGVIVPDDKFVNTLKLDPTHKYFFTLEKLTKLFKNQNFKILKKGIAIPHWSIYLIAQK